MLTKEQEFKLAYLEHLYGPLYGLRTFRRLIQETDFQSKEAKQFRDKFIAKRGG